MFIARPDAQLYAAAFGAGPRTILALGGWVGSWELWVEPLGLLSQSWRTVAFDHRGCGATRALPESITFSNMVADVLAVADALAIEQCVLAAESAGVAVALQAALEHPQRFTGLVAAAGVFYRPTPTAPDPFVASLRANYTATMAYFVDACVPEPSSELIRAWGRQIVGRATPEAAIRLYESLYGIDLRPRVGQLRQPTLLLHGTADAIQPIAESEWLAAQIPTNAFVRLEGAGHVPSMTCPGEVAHAIAAYFGG